MNKPTYKQEFFINETVVESRFWVFFLKNDEKLVILKFFFVKKSRFLDFSGLLLCFKNLPIF